jgi:hypothetical protein
MSYAVHATLAGLSGIPNALQSHFSLLSPGPHNQ